MSAAPWRGVALLTIPGLNRCTAFLLAPQVAVTAAHCLFGARLGHFAPPAAVHVLTGYASGNFLLHSLVVSYRVAPGYDPQAPAQTRGADVAVLRLAEPVIGAAAVLALAEGGDATGAPAALGGYDQDHAEVIEADLGCHVGGAAQDGGGRPLIRHDCAATHGSSGAPLLLRTAGGWRVIGVQVAGRPGVAGGVAVPASVLRGMLALPGP